ncbi:MAG: DeoR family transcriptional regulator, partial [Candidatus Staskawiczbacteria bacterium]
NEYEKIRENVKPINITIPVIQEKQIQNSEIIPAIKEQDIKISEDIILDDDGFIKETVSDLSINNKPQVSTEIDKGEKIIYSDRQNKIIEFLNKNGKAQVMDLQTVLPNITKRTIRRDLDDLLESGKIARLGDFNQVSYKIKDSQVLVN